MIRELKRESKSKLLKRGLIFQISLVLVLFVGGVSAAAILGSPTLSNPKPTTTPTSTYLLIKESPSATPVAVAEVVPESPVDDEGQQQYVPSRTQTRSDCGQLFMAYHDQIQAEVRMYYDQNQALIRQKSEVQISYGSSQEFIDNGYAYTPAMQAELDSLDAQAAAANDASQAAFSKHNIPWHYPGCQ